MAPPPSSDLRKAWADFRKSYGEDGWWPGLMQRFMQQRGYLSAPHPEYEWTEARSIQRADHGNKIDTLWRIQDNVLIVAQIHNDDNSMSDVSWLGDASNKEGLCVGTYYREPWLAVKKCHTHGHLLVTGAQKTCPLCAAPWAAQPKGRVIRGNARRTYWETGGYDRGEGETLSRQFQWARVENYDYEESRRDYSAWGMTRREADLAARRSFKSLKERYEGYLKGDWWFIGVWTHFYAIEDIEDFDPEDPDIASLRSQDALART